LAKKKIITGIIHNSQPALEMAPNNQLSTKSKGILLEKTTHDMISIKYNFLLTVSNPVFMPVESRGIN